LKNTKNFHASWSSRWTFILAAAGSAVGLGNIWKFPYIAGENGGGAFVIVYILCIVIVALPIMVAEVTLGRMGKKSPVNTIRDLIQSSDAHKSFNIIGWMGVSAGLLILSYYAVIAGWALSYIEHMISGTFHNINAENAGLIFDNLLKNKNELIFWQSLFMLMTVIVVIFGINKGLGLAAQILMPLLFILLIGLLIFGYQQGDLAKAFSFLFGFNFESLSWKAVLVALGHAFFTLSIGMGAMMTYGVYMPKDSGVFSNVLIVGILDTLVALIAGLVIFSIVFVNPSIESSAGPGLMFVSLPVAFGNMLGGLFFGTIFFVLVTLAAWSSSISLIEPAIAYLIESKGYSRLMASLALGFIAWIIGLGSVFSFNIWAEEKIAGFNFFELIDFITANIMLPLSGLLVAILIGWKIQSKMVEDQLLSDSRRLFFTWQWAIKFISPLAVIIVLIMGIYPRLV
jgi:NSS family neurotransmitter:Na+ symporter|tara:strand:- start:3573 stop:4940 length:1368 start_codon:yes stop_codon:yes gene_type:complete